MNLDRMIRELRLELADMNRAIESLEGLVEIGGGNSPGRRRTGGKKAAQGEVSGPDAMGATPEEYAGAD